MATEVLGGYRLINLMMTGQTSQVWEAVETASGRHFAVKLLLPEKAREAEWRRSLLHEADVGIKLRHPNVIRIVTVVKDKYNPYFVMEFFPAGSLKLRLMRKQLDFIKEKCHDILKQGATALAYMNANGYVHRDVKLDNFLVNSAGDLRLIDFALAQRIKRRGLFSKLFKRKGPVSGTRSYMSPEQNRGEALDGRADIYSFGASCYELVTGRLPFVGMSSHDLLTKHITDKPAPLQSYNKDVSDEFNALVLHMLAKKREERPRDFHEILMKLRTIKIYKSEAAPKAPG